MMRTKRLRTRLLVSLVTLFALVLSAVYLAVYTSTTLSAERQARQQLEVGSKVLLRLLELRGRELAGATDVLIADFGFRAAVSSADLPTIGSALINQANRIGADEAMLFDADGALIASSRIASQSLPELQAATALEDSLLLAVIDDRPYILVSSVVRAPMPIGEVAMAFALDDEVAAEMERLTGLAVRFATFRGGELLSSVATPAAPLADEVTQADVEVSDDYLTTRVTLLDAGGLTVTSSLYSPLDQALAMFDVLKRNLLLITLAALALSTLAAWWLAVGIAQPVTLLAAAARKIGLGDYTSGLSLDRDDELGHLARSIDAMREEISTREQRIRYSATHDPLTALANLSTIREALRSGLERSGNGTLALLNMAEAEQLINAGGQGHFEAIIVQMAGLLQAEVGRDALPAYQPGMGFILLLDRLDLEHAIVVVEAVLERLGEPVGVDGQTLRLDWAAGLTEWPRHASDPDELIRQAGIAYADARSGRERAAVYQSQRDAAFMRRVRLIRDIRHAAAQGELSIVYQPKLDLRTGRVQQVESLMRWNHPLLGFVPPDEFILLAEQTGSISLLTRWLIDTVLDQLAVWQRQGVHLQAAMNLSAHDLDDEAFPERVILALQSAGLNASSISFEVTESALMKDPETSLRCLRRLRDHGIHLAVDDYGTGYSSLATLKSLPVQELKIDKSFVLPLATSQDDAIIVHSTIELGHNMGLTIVAEGVEDATSLDWLRSHGCDLVQGYFVSRPLAADALLAWLQTRTAPTSKETS
ncbi:EAL domain-containing protein [Halopseudomonas nanhaiensis]|uniref:putative bifunctional diguanylate cyclase/phosphodiesterase n=1 Tax=Halopseudomonas nanhaiensis TaxID=2830842 RepID=UPI001CBEFC4C|nr:EAL domain-containing protein [Halopseudomonas nanhaiensis]UAW99371.1 EAL domain-containing protein [Halopseudomonas nanhaiensis]